MTLKAAVKALRDDAGIWQDVATTTATAARSVDGLTLSEGELSWASNPTGLLVTYEEIRLKAARLLGEATTNFNELSATLEQVAADYETSDEKASANLKGTWDARR